jgi:uncharacterized protein (DUF486 family)
LEGRDDPNGLPALRPEFRGHYARTQMLGWRYMLTVILLLISNTFMTFAWYGHLKHRSWTLLEAIIFSWLIALGEYCFQVPANRFGYGRFTGYQLKIIQEAITLVVFAVFAYLYLGEDLRWNYAASGVCLFGAVVFAFWGRA